MLLTDTRAKGRKKKKRCGRNTMSRRDAVKLAPSVLRPDAFSMMPLPQSCISGYVLAGACTLAKQSYRSIMVIKGATSTAAAPAETKSAPTRHGSQAVFQAAGEVLPVFFPASGMRNRAGGRSSPMTAGPQRCDDDRDGYICAACVRLRRRRLQGHAGQRAELGRKRMMR